MIHDVPPPQNDHEAEKLAVLIHDWIAKDRPGKEVQKPKKKRGLLGRFRR